MFLLRGEVVRLCVFCEVGVLCIGWFVVVMGDVVWCMWHSQFCVCLTMFIGMDLLCLFFVHFLCIQCGVVWVHR